MYAHNFSHHVIKSIRTNYLYSLLVLINAGPTQCNKSYHTYYDDEQQKNINYKCKNDPKNPSKCEYSWDKLNDDNCKKTCKRKYYKFINNVCTQFFPSRDQINLNELPPFTFSTDKC